MSAHALLSPSSAHRWLNCPRAPRLEATLPEKTSSYAQEGTLAHSVCEITAKKHFNKIKPAEYTQAIKDFKADSFWNDEMIRTAETYVEHLAERAMAFKNEPYVTFEVKVDISDYAPEAFGRCDCIMFGDETLVITDYKHGKGVQVNAVENPQLMLYALGALKLYQPIFGGGIKRIEVCIDQPRLGHYETWNCTSDELLAWGDGIKPKALAAYRGEGEFNAGSWCKFCRANGVCKAQAEQEISAFDDFVGAVDQTPAMLSPEDMSAMLKRGETLVDWYESLKQAALEKLLEGVAIPDFKVVEGRSSRVWTDQDKALEKLEADGVEHAMLYDTVPKSLAKIEKMLGIAKFKELVGEFVMKPQGKPTLTTADDTRHDYNGAVADFAAVAG